MLDRNNSCSVPEKKKKKITRSSGKKKSYTKWNKMQPCCPLVSIHYIAPISL